MDIKYLSDDKGKITGVFIPIDEWEQLKKQYSISEKPAVDSAAKLQQSLSEAMKKAKPDSSAS